MSNRAERRRNRKIKNFEDHSERYGEDYKRFNQEQKQFLDFVEDLPIAKKVLLKKVIDDGAAEAAGTLIAENTIIQRSALFAMLVDYLYLDPQEANVLLNIFENYVEGEKEMKNKVEESLSQEIKDFIYKQLELDLSQKEIIQRVKTKFTEGINGKKVTVGQISFLFKEVKEEFEAIKKIFTTETEEAIPERESEESEVSEGAGEVVGEIVPSAPVVEEESKSVNESFTKGNFLIKPLTFEVIGKINSYFFDGEKVNVGKSSFRNEEEVLEKYDDDINKLEIIIRSLREERSEILDVFRII